MNGNFSPKKQSSDHSRQADGKTVLIGAGLRCFVCERIAVGMGCVTHMRVFDVFNEHRASGRTACVHRWEGR